MLELKHLTLGPLGCRMKKQGAREEWYGTTDGVILTRNGPNVFKSGSDHKEVTSAILLS